MSNFKLIAIRPLFGCEQKYHKVLTPGKVYSLYQGYRIVNRRGTSVVKDDEVMGYVAPKGKRLKIHDVETADGHPLHINISAVVGKNGSGKSTLMDLFFAAIYLASVSDGLLKDTPKRLREELELLPEQLTKQNERWTKALQTQQDLRERFNANQQKPLKPPYDFDEITGDAAINEQWIIQHKKLLDNLHDREKTVRDQLAEMRQMAKELQAEIYYQFNRSFFCLRVVPEENGDPGAELFRLHPFTADAERSPLQKLPLSLVIKQQHFFYTVGINYSHYALNALNLGQWVNSIFHKNDGYKTPIVLNPMRKKGVFDINTELQLGKYRLLSNLLVQRQLLKDREKEIQVTDHLFAHRVWLTVDLDKVESNIRLNWDGLQGEKADVYLIEDVFQVFFGDADFARKLPHDNGLVDLVLNYIIKKVKDVRKYDGLGHVKLTEKERSGSNRHYLKQLRDEPSHIVFKLKQAIHFLQRAADQDWPNPFELRTNAFHSTRPIIFKPTLKELVDWAGDVPNGDMINFLPPAIFKIDLELSGEGQSRSFFHELSSGEQQMINTIQTVLYHLNNLQSVRYSKLPRMHYRAINLVFDEIELYFHPAFQRSFIDELLKALRRLFVGPEQAIEAINVVFLTHSPFILSDIPKDQITLMSVEKGAAVTTAPESETFAANINELLAGSFFLEGTLMGVLAEHQVNGLINAARSPEGLNDEQRRILDLIGDSYLRNSLKHFINHRYDQDQAQ